MLMTHFPTVNCNDLEEFSGGESDVDDNRSDDGGNVEQQRRVAAANAHFDERVAAMEKEIHAKQLRLEQEKGMAESERRTLAEELMKKEGELRHSKDEHERLMSKLASIEKKLIIGGENMLEKAEKQAKLLDESNKYARNQLPSSSVMIVESLRRHEIMRWSFGSD